MGFKDSPFTVHVSHTHTSFDTHLVSVVSLMIFQKKKVRQIPGVFLFETSEMQSYCKGLGLNWNLDLLLGSYVPLVQFLKCAINVYNSILHIKV